MISTAAATTPDALRVVVVDRLDALDSVRSAWHDLAVERGCPGALPTWQLAWWRHLAPAGAELRALVVRDRDDAVVGIASFCAERLRGAYVYRLLAAGITHRVEPVCRPGVDEAVATALATSLARIAPPADVLHFEAIDATSPWLRHAPAHWPQSRWPWILTERHQPAPVITLGEGGFDDWMASKGRRFRERIRRARRKFEQAGGAVRLSTPERAGADLAAFERLHRLRWSDEGGSSLGTGVRDMLAEATAEMVPSGNMRIWVAEIDDEPVCVHVMLAAGGNVIGWSSGLDAERAGSLSPSQVILLTAIERGFDLGDVRIDLGGGAHPYKLRFADGDAPLVWSAMVPRDRRYLRARAALLPQQLETAGRTVLHRLPAERQQQLRTTARRLRARAGAG